VRNLISITWSDHCSDEWEVSYRNNKSNLDHSIYINKFDTRARVAPSACRAGFVGLKKIYNPKFDDVINNNLFFVLFNFFISFLMYNSWLKNFIINNLFLAYNVWLKKLISNKVLVLVWIYLFWFSPFFILFPYLL
jgi:hypothetical protein